MQTVILMGNVLYIQHILWFHCYHQHSDFNLISLLLSKKFNYRMSVWILGCL